LTAAAKRVARNYYPRLRRTVTIELLTGRRRPGRISLLSPLTARLSGTGTTKTIVMRGVSHAKEV
jgi:hypothetical protein